MIDGYQMRRLEKHRNNIIKALEKDFQKSLLVELCEDVDSCNTSLRNVKVKVLIDGVLFLISLDNAILRTSERLIYYGFFDNDLCKCYTIKFVYKNIDKFKLHGDDYYIRYADLISLLKGISKS